MIELFIFARSTRRKWVILSFLVLLFTANQADAGYVNVTKEEIKTTFYAKRFVFVASRNDVGDRVGAAFGLHDRRYEIFAGVHDNLKPFVEGAYKLNERGINVVFNAYVQSDNSEMKSGYEVGINTTYLVTDNFGISCNYDTNGYLRFGVRKWF